MAYQMNVKGREFHMFIKGLCESDTLSASKICCRAHVVQMLALKTTRIMSEKNQNVFELNYVRYVLCIMNNIVYLTFQCLL